MIAAFVNTFINITWLIMQMAAAIHCKETPIEDNRFPITAASSVLLCQRTFIRRIMRRKLFSDRVEQLQSRRFIGLCIVVEYSAFMGIPRWFGHVALELNRPARRTVRGVNSKASGQFTVNVRDQTVRTVRRQTGLEWHEFWKIYLTMNLWSQYHGGIETNSLRNSSGTNLLRQPRTKHTNTDSISRVNRHVPSSAETINVPIQKFY